MDRTLRTAIITVNYNGGEVLLQTIASLYEHTPKEAFDFYLADNGSQDGSAQKAKEMYPDIIIVDNGENLGFGKGHNKVFPVLRDHEKREGFSYDFIALINPDLILTANWLEELQQTILRNHNVGAVNPLILYSDRFHLLKAVTTNPSIYLYHEDYRFLANLVGKNEGAVEQEEKLKEAEELRLAAEETYDKNDEESFWKHVAAENAEASLDLHYNTKEIFIGNKAYIQVNNREFNVLLDTKYTNLDLEVYDEGLNGFKLWVGGTKAEYGSLQSIFRKLFFKMKWVDISAKIQEYSFPKSRLKIEAENIEVINSLGSGIKAGNELPDNNFYGAPRSAAPRSEHEVQLFHGSCVLLKRSVLDDVPEFDPQYFMYYEESDFGLQMREKGYRVMANPKAIVYHKERGNRSEKTIEFMQDSARKFIAKWGTKNL